MTATLINPAGIQQMIDKLKPDTVELAAAGIAKVGDQVGKQGAALQKTWHGLAHSYEAPESDKLLTIMEPVKKATTSFDTDTGKVEKALKAYALEEQLIKDELIKLKAEAEMFVARVSGGVDQPVVVGRALSTKSVPWHEDQATIDANTALGDRVAARVTALEQAQQRCASAIGAIMGVCLNTSPAPAAGTATTSDEPYVPPWGGTGERTKHCGERFADGVGRTLWTNGLKPILVMDAMGYLGYNPQTGAWFDYRNSIPQLGQMGLELTKNLGKLGVGLVVLTSPGLLTYAMTGKGAFAGFLRSSLGTTGEFGKGLIAYDTFKSGDIAGGIGEAGSGIALLFVPGAGEAGVAVKGVTTATRLTRAGLMTTEVLADGSKIMRFTDAGMSALKAGKLDSGLADLLKLKPNLVLPDGTRLSKLGLGDGKLFDTDLPKIPEHGTSTSKLPHEGSDLPPVRSGDHPSNADHSSQSSHNSADAHQPGHESAPSYGADTNTGHEPGSGDHPADAPGNGHGTKDSPREYHYENRAEELRGHAKPSEETMRHIDTKHKSLAGTEQHMLESWRKYLDRNPGTTKNWDSWRNTYIANQGNEAKGTAYEIVVRESLDLNGGGREYNTNVEINGQTRNYDVLDTKGQVAYEIKSGNSVSEEQIAKDKGMLKTGYEVKYVFGQEPTAAARKLLDEAGIEYQVLYGKPVVHAGS